MKRLSRDFYILKEISSSSWEVILTDASHRVFQAHFKSNPLVPAFLQMDIFGQIQSKKIIKIDRAKFKIPILPNDRVVYKIAKKIDDRYRVKIFKNDLEASDFRITLQ
jgi:3-hydroxyacyl-[acyl-carrier-protein] dehydratase